MPFISLKKAKLINALTICNQISPKKSDVDIFTYLKVSLTNNSLNLAALSSTAFYKTSLAFENLNDVVEKTFLLKTDMFFNTVNIISDDEIGLEIDFDKLIVTVTGSKTKHALRFEVDKVDDFSEPQEKPDELDAKIKVKSGELLTANKVALTTVGLPKNVYQVEFLSVCYTLKASEKKLVVVSCDKFRISKNNLEIEIIHTSDQLDTEKHNFLIVPKGLVLLNSILDTLEEVELNFEKTSLWINFGDSCLVIKYGDGVYPDYEKIIPQSFSCTFIANVKEIKESLKQVSLIARANSINKSVAMEVIPSKKQLILTSKSDDGNYSEAVVDLVSYEGIEDNWTQTFNSDYLSDYINYVTTDNLLLEVNPGKPMVMSPEKLKETQLCLVQSLR
jgi:DNA polymerase-3 subunit beta